jgi:hypothetical protein
MQKRNGASGQSEGHDANLLHAAGRNNGYLDVLQVQHGKRDCGIRFAFPPYGTLRVVYLFLICALCV